MSIQTYDLNDSRFLRELSGLSSKDAKNIGLEKLIENNTTITRLSLYMDLFNIKLSNIANYKALFKGMVKNTTLKYLKLMCDYNNGNLYGFLRIPNCTIETLYLHIDDSNQLDFYTIMLTGNTTLKKLVINDRDLTFKNKSVNFCEFLSKSFLNTLVIPGIYPRHLYDTRCLQQYINCINTNLRKLIIPNLTGIDMKDLLNKRGLKKLSVHESNMNFNLLKGYHSIESLTIHYDTATVAKFKNLVNLFRNMSIIKLRLKIKRLDVSQEEYDNTVGVMIDSILGFNRKLRWNYIHSQTTDIVIAMSSIIVNSEPIPSYVILWIIDWLYPDNPYSTHLKKITLIMNLHKSIRKLKCINYED